MKLGSTSLKEGPHDDWFRAAQQALESVGGKVDAFYFALGGLKGDV